MSQFSGFKDSFLKSNPESSTNSDTVSGSDSVSPPPVELSKQKSLNIPNIKTENVDNLLSKSLDIKKQLSQSFQGNAGSSSHGGITKPQSRKNSTIAIKSNGGTDNEEDDEDENQGNERKRRDNINDKIQELLMLIPSEFFQDKETKVAEIKEEDKEEAELAAAVKSSGTKDGKPNKGQILTKSVEYLQHLQNSIDENNRKEVELIMRLKNLELQLQNKPQNVPISVGNTSAERALGKIGVGPLSDDYFKSVLVNSANTNKGTQRKGSV